MKLTKTAQEMILTRKPQLIEHFYSLEGEGQTIGRSSLFIRTNQCQLKCTFCDTSFSIKGDAEQLVTDMTSDLYVEYMKEQYSNDIRQNTENLSITGGEPLLNLLYLDKILDKTLLAFPNINKVVIETNGYLLRNKELCLKLIDMLSPYVPDIKFTLSMSPKLNSEVSHANKDSNDQIIRNYESVLKNYDHLLRMHFDLQIKVVYSEALKVQDERIIDFAINDLKTKIKREKILIMPLTPNDPTDKDKEEWSASKDIAARYALKNHFRYSPRIHIDRRLD